MTELAIRLLMITIILIINVDGDVSDDNDGDGSEDDDEAAGELFSLGCSVCVCGQQRNQTIDL